MKLRGHFEPVTFEHHSAIYAPAMRARRLDAIDAGADGHFALMICNAEAFHDAAISEMLRYFDFINGKYLREIYFRRCFDLILVIRYFLTYYFREPPSRII